jgi:hypothetical protein
MEGRFAHFQRTRLDCGFAALRTIEPCSLGEKLNSPVNLEHGILFIVNLKSVILNAMFEFTGWPRDCPPFKNAAGSGQVY